MEEIEAGAFAVCEKLKGVYLEGEIKSGFADRKYKAKFQEKQIMSGWDYHTHVGDPPMEIIEVGREVHEAWTYCNKKYENFAEADFDELIKNLK